MSDNRLREIALGVIEQDGPLSLMAYLVNLSETDIHYILNYIKNSKYSGEHLSLAIRACAYDYLNSIGYDFSTDVKQPGLKH